MAALILMGSLTAIALAAEGDLDPGFNGGQPVVVSGPPNSVTKLNGVAKQADGKVIVVGTTDTGSGSGTGTWLIERFLTNGQLDSAFGPGGVVSLNMGAIASASAVVVQPSDQRILIGGEVDSSGTFGAEFVRLKTDGSLDASFGGTGMVLLSQPGIQVLSTGGLALDSSGNAYLAGGGTQASANVGVIASTSSAGVPNGWAPGGILVPNTTTTGPRAQFSSVAVSGGSVFFAGAATDSSLNSYALIGAVSASDGSAAAAFGASGLFRLSQGTAFNGLLLAADGKLKATGYGTGAGPGTGALIASFNTTGANPTDTAFGQNGRVIVGGATNQPNNGNAITEASGKLFAATTAVLSNSTQPALVGLDEITGALDMGLGSGGFRLYSLGATSYATGIADPNGDAVITAVFDQAQGGSDMGALFAPQLAGGTGGGGTPPCTPVKLEAFKTVSLFKRSPDPGFLDRATIGQGEQFAYRIEIANVGTCPAKNVILSDVLPASFRAGTFANGTLLAYAFGLPAGQSTTSQKVAYTVHLETGNTLTMTLGDLAPGDRFVAFIPGSTRNLTRETNTATVNAVGVSINTNESRVTVTQVPQEKDTSVNATGACGKATAVGQHAADTAAAASPLARLSRLANVDVAVESLPGKHQRVGGACLWLDRRGHLKRLKAGANGACNAPLWLRAHGTTRWRYRFKPRLPHGKYELLVRVVNRGGVYDTIFSPAHHNLVRFAVR